MAFPYKPKPNHSIQKKFFLGGGICGLIILAIFMIYTAFPSPTAFDDHSIMVDPTVEKQSLFTIARVTIQNTGTSQLTNLTINYGDNDIDSIGTLDPGKTIILSHPSLMRLFKALFKEGLPHCIPNSTYIFSSDSLSIKSFFKF